MLNKRFMHVYRNHYTGLVIAGPQKNISKPANAFYEFFCNARYLHIHMNRTPPPPRKREFYCLNRRCDA